MRWIVAMWERIMCRLSSRCTLETPTSDDERLHQFRHEYRELERTVQAYEDAARVRSELERRRRVT